MSSQPPKKKKIRFGGETTKVFEKTTAAATTTTNDENRLDSGADADQAAAMSRRRPKRPRQERPNADEMDDVDDYVAEEDEDNGNNAIPGEAQTLQAKRRRRLKQHNENDDEDNDHQYEEDDEELLHDTSLATEGIPIEPFSMEQEKNDGTGFFDGDTFVFRRGGGRDVNEEADAWLDNLNNNENEEEQDGLAKPKQQQPEQESSSTNKMDSLSDTALYAKLLPLVSDSETIAQAIVRFGTLIPKNVKKKSRTKTSAQREGQDDDDNNNNDSNTPQARMAKQALEDLTEAANALLLRGQVSIYQKTRQDLLKLLPDNNHTSTTSQSQHHEKNETSNNDTAGPSPSNNNQSIQWEYQGNQDGGQIHGPYTTQQMQGWIQMGYFVGAQAVKVRTVQQKDDSSRQDQPKSVADDLLSDLMEDDDDDANGDNDKKQEAEQRGEWQMSDKVDFAKYL